MECRQSDTPACVKCARKELGDVSSFSCDGPRGHIAQCLVSVSHHSGILPLNGGIEAVSSKSVSHMAVFYFLSLSMSLLQLCSPTVEH